MTTFDTNSCDWTAIARACDCIQLACINPQDLPEGLLQRSLSDWQHHGNKGSLAYVDQRTELLTQPFETRPWAKSALVLSFAPEEDPDSPINNLPPATDDGFSALIAPYALNRDYHQTGQDILERLCTAILQLPHQQDEPVFDCCVDSKPVMEKQLAKLAGLGVQGYNSLIRNSTHGAQLHLAVCFTSIPLPTFFPAATPPAPCDSCRRCLNACPNHVFTQDGTFKVKDCRAWIASEYRGPLTLHQIRQLGNTLFGCGICSAVCPAQIPPRKPYNVDPAKLIAMPTAELKNIIKNSTLERTGPTLLKRNAVACAFNQATTEQWNTLANTFRQQSQSPTVQQTIHNTSQQ